MGAGFGAPPAAMPASFPAPVSGGLDDLFDLGGSVGMPMGAYSPPKSVSLDNLGSTELQNNVTAVAGSLMKELILFMFRFGFQP